MTLQQEIEGSVLETHQDRKGEDGGDVSDPTPLSLLELMRTFSSDCDCGDCQAERLVLVTRARDRIEALESDKKLLSKWLADSSAEVDRLREFERWFNEGCHNGADLLEIESLRSELAHYEMLKHAINESGDCLSTCDSIAHDEQCPNVNMHVVLQDQQREIEKLREDETNAIEFRRVLADELEKRDATITQLRAWLRNYQPSQPSQTAVEYIQIAEGRIAALEAEVERLRGLLRDCRARTYGGYPDEDLKLLRGRIDAALEGKPATDLGA